MKKAIIFVSVLLLFFRVAGFLYGAIPAEERAALIALYNATNGDYWIYNSGWKDEPLESDGFGPIGSEGSWSGITVSEDHVESIYLSYLSQTDWMQKMAGDASFTIPSELGDLNQLKYLTLISMDLRGDIPPELGNLGNLTKLELTCNQLSGSIPPELGNLNNLTILDLYNNQLSGSIPPELANLSNLTMLDLDGNQLSGLIPPELGNLDNLVYLYLYNNQLSGSIPPELGNLSNLTILDLYNNHLSNSIPPELGNLNNLVGLCLHNNQLSGFIPPELGNFSNLATLKLNGNQLSGSIPPELGNLNKLFELYLYNNQLSGSIPPELGNLTNLRFLYFNQNKLTGTVPASITNLTQLILSDIGYNGLYTNNETVRTFMNAKDDDWEETQTIAPSNVRATTNSTTSIIVTWTPILYTGDTGGYKIYYSLTSCGPLTYAGMTSDKSASFFELKNLIPGTKYYFIVETQTNSHSNNTNTVVSEVSEEVSAATITIPPGQDQPPFGFMDYPLGGDTPVSGSIAVSGWALDDIEVISVKIYNVLGNSITYIGDAVFVEGARTDIEQAYPTYPNYKRAGWGYMLLTNFLPNRGNGTYTLRAVAVDSRDHETILGSKTIVCDNANAVEPFGAIDTPTQGGAASGSNFRNQGWVLTPMPNKIPEDGSTINVYVDGAFLGNTTYNLYREDIATLFPGYANSDGAWAYFDFDTTGYSDGIHTIYWTAEDDAGNADGIGSRYFSIQNTEGRGNPMRLPESLSNIPVDYSSPVGVKKGYRRNEEPLEIYPDSTLQGSEKGIVKIEIKTLERVEIWVRAQYTAHTMPGRAPLYSGYQIVGSQLRHLPIGSTLDSERGVFYWTPGPGFIGTYRFVFVERSGDEMVLKYVNVRIRDEEVEG